MVRRKDMETAGESCRQHSIWSRDNSLIIAPEGTTCDMRCKGKGIVSSPLSSHFLSHPLRFLSSFAFHLFSFIIK